MKTIYVVFTVCWAFTAIADEWGVILWTSDIKDADTDAGIFATLIGVNGTDERKRIAHQGYKYEKGTIVISMYTTEFLGNLTKVVIENDMEGEHDPGWMVSKVVVKAWNRSTELCRYEWTPNEWLWDGEVRGRQYSTRLELPVVLTNVCDPGWSFNPQSASCYKYFRNATWHVANSDCRRLGAYIARPKTIEDNEFLYTFKESTDIWIGLTDRDTEGILVWEDSTPFNSPSRLKAHPDDHEGVRYDCAQLVGTMASTRKPTYHMKDCDMRADFFCEKNWVCDPNSHTCYSYHPDEKSYTEASDHCALLGRSLPMPKTEAENTFLYSIKPPSKPIWLGLTDLREEDSFFWNDGYSLTWSNWHSGQPNNYEDQDKDQDCTIMYRYAPTWYDDFCRAPYFRPKYFCEDKHVTT